MERTSDNELEDVMPCRPSHGRLDAGGESAQKCSLHEQKAGRNEQRLLGEICSSRTATIVVDKFSHELGE
jgi:hypothetical protein